MRLLVLLIGGNPIANLALIKYFKTYSDDKNLIGFDKVVLIFTAKTEELANNIKTLNENVNFIDINLENKERDINFIQDKVVEKIKELNPKAVHLNYTGGTKPMSLGAFLAINGLNENINKIFSDISPITYKLYLKRGEEFPEEGNIAQDIKMTIEEFCLLYGATIENKKQENSEFYKKQFIEFLFKKYKDNDSKFFDIWKQDFRELKKMERNELKNSLKDINFSFDIEKLSNKKLEKFQKYINGIFLEEYVFNVLNNIKDEIQINDLAWNVEIINKRGKNFELDIVVTKGYTAYVISCTTDKRAYIKQKAFEATIRTEQIGGIGAKPILICFADEEIVEKTKDEMINYAGKNSFEIIGFEDIKNIKINLKKIIK